MNCPKCGSNNSSVKDSRPEDCGIRRRRGCAVCGNRFSTIEILHQDYKAMKKRETVAHHLIEAIKTVEEIMPMEQGVKPW